jgi:serine/threonine protein kinase/tetratricopeptide (TPR) repeat protein
MTHDTRLGPFTVDHQIGEGGMGAVYRGTHRGTDVPVAIKVIHQRATEGARDRFHEEVQAHAGLLHPGIVYLFEYGEVDESAALDETGLEAGSPFVTMELADRGTVRDVLPVNDWKTVCRLLVQILDALAYAHARGVVHRDLKPENFLLFDAGDETVSGSEVGWRVKLADFGIAHAFDREREIATTNLEAAAGTPLYMAPEQLGGMWREFGPWTDLYALGCIAYELVCGRPPFEGDSAFGAAKKHATASRPPLDPRCPVPDELERWIHRAMAVDPDRRFRRAADAAWALPGGVLVDDEGPGGDGSPETTSRESTDEYLGETRSRGLTATIVLDETARDDTPPALEEVSTRVESDGGEVFGRAETAAAVDAEVESGTPDGADSAGRFLETLHPPLPDEWRPAHTDPIPAPLVGAGLGLFGLREPPFVDRREACGEVWEALKRVVEQGSVEAVFVAGEAGTGKSRLAEWMTTRAHEVGAARIVRAVHTPEGGSSEGLRGALERTLRTVKMDRGDVYEHLAETLPALAGRGGESVDDDARALTEYLRPTDDGSEEVGGPRFRFSSARQKRALLVRTLERLAARRSVILWLDDLQWGDEAIGVLEHLRERRSEPPRMLVLATVRSDIVADQPNLAGRLDSLQRDERSTRLELEPLAREYQRDLLMGLLPLEEDLADRLADRTEGHPLFAMQLLGHWIDRGDLEVGDHGFRVPEGSTVELPDDIHQLWLDRIDRMLQQFGESADNVLVAVELAATLGRQVDYREWARLLDDADLEVPDGLVDRLIDRGLAERTADGWAFAHGMLVDSLIRRASEADRLESHHRRCGRMLASRSTGETLGYRERIAEHWVAGGCPERSLEPLLDEVNLCIRSGRTMSARRLLDRRGEVLDRLQVPEADGRRTEQQVWASQLDAREGHPERACRSLGSIWETLEDDQPHLRSLCAHFMTQVQERLGHRNRALEWAERALEASRRSDDLSSRANCHRRLAWLRWDEGNMGRAEHNARRAVELAERTDDQYQKLDSLRTRAVIRRDREGYSGEEIFEEIRRKAAEGGYVALEAQANNQLGEAARWNGDLAEARRYYRDYLKIIRQLSRPMLESLAHLNLGQVELRTGHLEGLREHLEAAERNLDAVGVQKSEDLVHLLRLGDAAGTADRSTFAELWAPLADGWPEDWRVIKDHPWLLETIGEYAEEAGWEEAREVWRLGAELWGELGDEEAAEELRRKHE